MNDKSKDIRWKQRFTNFEKVILLLERTLQIEEPSEAEIGGLIQFYEVAFELAWKLMKDYLAEEGQVVKSPREAIKQAFQSGLIADAQVWIDALHDRNLTTHTYDESITLQVVTDIETKYYSVLNQLYMDMKARLTPCNMDSPSAT